MTGWETSETPPSREAAPETSAEPDCHAGPDASAATEPAAGSSAGASGDRAVAIAGDAHDSQIITGDNAVVTIDRRSIRIALQAGYYEIEVHVGAPAADGTHALALVIPG